MSKQRRIELGEKLKDVLGSDRTYFQPTNKTILAYPCCIYNYGGVKTIYANNLYYHNTDRYTVTFISKDPDNTYLTDMYAMFPYARFDRRYIADNLYHDVFTLYY